MTGESNAKSGGGAEVVYGVLSAGDVSCDSDGITVTLPSNIKTLCGLNVNMAESGGVMNAVIVFPGVPSIGAPEECATVYNAMKYNNNAILGAAFREITVSGNKAYVDTNAGDYTFYEGVYAYIPE